MNRGTANTAGASAPRPQSFQSILSLAKTNSETKRREQEKKNKVEKEELKLGYKSLEYRRHRKRQLAEQQLLTRKLPSRSASYPPRQQLHRNNDNDNDNINWTNQGKESSSRIENDNINPKKKAKNNHAVPTSSPDHDVAEYNDGADKKKVEKKATFDESNGKKSLDDCILLYSKTTRGVTIDDGNQDCSKNGGHRTSIESKQILQSPKAKIANMEASIMSQAYQQDKKPQEKDDHKQHKDGEPLLVVDGNMLRMSPLPSQESTKALLPNGDFESFATTVPAIEPRTHENERHISMDMKKKVDHLQMKLDSANAEKSFWVGICQKQGNESKKTNHDMNKRLKSELSRVASLKKRLKKQKNREDLETKCKELEDKVAENEAIKANNKNEEEKRKKKMVCLEKRCDRLVAKCKKLEDKATENEAMAAKCQNAEEKRKKQMLVMCTQMQAADLELEEKGDALEKAKADIKVFQAEIDSIRSECLTKQGLCSVLQKRIDSVVFQYEKQYHELEKQSNIATAFSNQIQGLRREKKELQEEIEDWKNRNHVHDQRLKASSLELERSTEKSRAKDEAHKKSLTEALEKQRSELEEERASTATSTQSNATTTRLKRDLHELQRNFNAIAMQNHKLTNTIDEQRQMIRRFREQLGDTMGSARAPLKVED